MRFTLVVLLGVLCALTLANPVHDGHYKVVDKQLLARQKDILRLFKYVNQPSYYKDHVDIAQNFKLFEDNLDSYVKPEVVKHFRRVWENGFLPRGHIFTVFNDVHLQQAIAFFKVLYYAKDYDMFYKVAVWGRQYVNEGIYLYALSVAIVHRQDTYGIVLPPIYEIYPYYFYSSDVISKVHKYKQIYYGDKVHETHGYTINANYSGYYLNLHPEQSMSYYLEDVGINSFYYYYNIYYPYWLDSKEFGFEHGRRGEQYRYVYQQLVARYYLERLSNDFGEIPFFNWDLPFETGYYPSLRYPNGLEFPTRPNYVNLHEYFYNYGQSWAHKSPYGYSYTKVQDYERRIRDAIDRGFIYARGGERVSLRTKEGINILGNLIEANPDSVDNIFYGPLHVYARHLLGYSTQPLDAHRTAPSALEHYETSLRDPAFYQLYKRINLYFDKYIYSLQPYEENELYFPGVEVQNVQFDRLVTYFDYFYSDLSQAAFVTPEEFESDSVQVKAKQYRLNHKPFTYKVHVNSNKDQDAVVKIFIGPKHDEYDRYINISENRHNFVQFDHFKFSLKAGENVIERNSHQNFFYHHDRTSYKELYQQVLGALEGKSEYHVDSVNGLYGFPLRYLLPKGTYGGYEYQFFVIVYPYVPYKGQTEKDFPYYPRVGTGAQYVDGYPLGYPFDRPIYYEKFFQDAPNTYYYTTKIYHRQVEDINASNFVHH